MKVITEAKFGELALTLIKVFNFKENENNWTSTAAAIRSISEVFVIDLTLLDCELNLHIVQILSVLEITVLK